MKKKDKRTKKKYIYLKKPKKKYIFTKNLQISREEKNCEKNKQKIAFILV